MGITPSRVDQALSDPKSTVQFANHANGLSPTSRINLKHLLQASEDRAQGNGEGGLGPVKRPTRRGRRGNEKSHRQAGEDTSQDDEHASYGGEPVIGDSSLQGSLFVQEGENDTTQRQSSSTSLEQHELKSSKLSTDERPPGANDHGSNHGEGDRGTNEPSASHQKAWKGILSLAKVELVEDIEAWKRDPRSFFSIDKSIDLGSASHPCIMAQYKEGLRLDANDKVDLVRWRFNMLFFNDLCDQVSLGNRPHSTRAALRLSKKDVAQVSKQISEIVHKSPDEVSPMIRKWRATGRRINAFVGDLGPGALFYFPSISRTIFSKHYSSSGSPHDAALAHFESLDARAVIEGSGANRLGKIIRDLSIGEATSEIAQASDQRSIVVPPVEGSAEHNGEIRSPFSSNNYTLSVDQFMEDDVDGDDTLVDGLAEDEIEEMEL